MSNRKILSRRMLSRGFISFSISLLMFSVTYAQQGSADHQQRREEFFAAVSVCAEENGIVLDFESGARPSEAERAVIDSCLTEKGIQVPHKRKRGGGGECAAPSASADQVQE